MRAISAVIWNFSILIQLTSTMKAKKQLNLSQMSCKYREFVDNILRDAYNENVWDEATGYNKIVEFTL